MMVTVLVWSTLVLISLHHPVHGQDECANWTQSSYTVTESDGLITLTAKLSEPASQVVFLPLANRDDSASKIQKKSYLTFCNTV